MNNLKNFLSEWKDAIAVLQNIITSIALIAGGIYAYFKIIKGRIYYRRLEPRISGRIISEEGYSCIIISVIVKNVGLTRIYIDQKRSTIEVKFYAHDDYEPQFHNAMWITLGVTTALQNHAWIEPGETVTEERLLALPKETPIALGLGLKLLPEQPAYGF